MRWRRGCVRLCVVLVAAGGLPGACGPEAHPDAEEASPWDAGVWRQRLEVHAAATERLLPVLSAAARAQDSGAYRDTLRTVHASLVAAEEAIPPIPWGVALSEAELHSKYRSSLRELRYGAEVMLEGLTAGDERRRGEARHFIDRGVRHFQEVREIMERPPRAPAPDTSRAAQRPPESA